jgi:hypothetical protein
MYNEYVYCLCIFSCAVRVRGEERAAMLTAGEETPGYDYFLLFSRVKGKNDVMIDCKKVKEIFFANKLV